MPLRQFHTPIPAFNAVAAGGQSVTRLPRNRRYHAVYLQYKTNANQATIEADITEIRLLVNSRVVRRFSAVQLNAINALNGRAFSAGIIPIYLSEPWRRTPEGEEYLAWCIHEDLGVGDFDIQVDIAGGAVAPTLTGWAVWDVERPADQFADILPNATPAQKVLAKSRRTVMHWLKQTTPCAAAFAVGAPLQPANFVPQVDATLHRVHFFDAVVTQARLRQNQTPIWDQDTVQLPATLLGYGMTKQANVFSLVVDYSQQRDDGLYIPAVPNLGLDLVTSGAAGGGLIASVMELRKNFDA